MPLNRKDSGRDTVKYHAHHYESEFLNVRI